MPDSTPLPPWGPASFDERDLDALLAESSLAETAGDIPPALRPVADTLAALQAAPSPAELRGEAAIMAEFRALAGFGEPSRGATAPSRHAPPAVGGGLAQTMPLAVASLPGRHRHGGGSRRGERGRRDRTPARARRGAVAVALATAAAAVIAIAAAYAGELPAPAQRLAHVALAAPSVRQAGGSKGASPGVDARSAQAVVSPSRPDAADAPSPTSAVSAPASGAPTPSRAGLCDAFITSLAHMAPGQPWWKSPAYKDVSAAAGGPQGVSAYCAAEWAKFRPHDFPQIPVYPGAGKQAPEKQRQQPANQQDQGQNPGQRQVQGQSVVGTGIPGQGKQAPG